MSERVVIDKGGRVPIPRTIRAAVGMESGDTVVVEERDGGIVILPEEKVGGLVRRNGMLFKPRTPGTRKISIEETLRMIEEDRLRGMPKAPPRRRAARKRPAA